MGFVERIFGKIRHLIENFIGNLFINAPGNTSRHIQRFIAINKVFPFLRHNIRFFLGHGTAHQIASSQIISGQLHNDLHHLFLINDTAIGRRQNFFQFRAVVNNRRLILLSFNISRYEIHRSRTIERNSRNNILQTGWLQFFHKPFHAAAFQLENALGFRRGNHFINLRVSGINVINIQRRFTAAVDELHRILNNRQCPQSEEVHFQKSQFFQRCHGKLGGDTVIHAS